MRESFTFAQGNIPTPLDVIGGAAIGLGDLWSDTSQAPPILKVCTSLNPVVFTAAGSAASFQTNGVNNSSQTTLNLTAGSNVTLTNTSGGNVQISAAGAGAVQFADEEIPTGTIDGSNATFTLAHTPNPSTSLLLYLNGVLQQQGASKDYTLATATITFTSAPISGDILLAWYRF